MELVYSVRQILVDNDRDVAVFEAMGFKGQPMILWSERLYGMPKIGSSIVSMGYPGYYQQQFIFEEGIIMDYTTSNGVSLLVSKGISYPGESGGPVISLHNGQVIGVVHALVEHIFHAGEDMHVHNTISLIVSWSEVRAVLEHARRLV
jgi:hypothetical protein